MPPTDFDEVRRLLAGVIPDERAIARLEMDSPLRASLPDLDSLAVAHLILAIEERHALVVDIEDVDDEAFATPRSLAAFIDRLRAREAGGAHRSG